MNTILAFGAVLLGSALAGRALYALESKIRSTALRWALSAFVALTALILSWGIFVYRSLVFRAADDSIFDERSSYVVTFRAPGSHDQTLLPSVAPPDGRPLRSMRTQSATAVRDSVASSLMQIEIVLPNAIKINQDAALDFSISPHAVSFPTPDYQVALKSGKEVQSRTLQPCTAQPASGGDSAQTSCAKGNLSEASAPVRWFVRSEKTGSSFVTIQLPQDVGKLLAERGAAWSATVSRNGELITKYLSGPEGRPWSEGQDRTGLRRRAVRDSAGCLPRPGCDASRLLQLIVGNHTVQLLDQGSLPRLLLVEQ